MNMTINETFIIEISKFEKIMKLGNTEKIIYFSNYDRLIFAIIICLSIKYGLKLLKQKFPIIQIKINMVKKWLIELLKSKRNI